MHINNTNTILNKAAFLAGGYIAGGQIDEQLVIDLLTDDNAIAANTNGTLMKQVIDDAPFVKTSQPSEPIKTIRKKVVQTPSAAPATNAVTHDAPRKIIKKTTCV